MFQSPCTLVCFSFVFNENLIMITASKASKYGVFSGPYFPVFGLNTEINRVFSPNRGKYGPENTPYFDTFYTVNPYLFLNLILTLFRFQNMFFLCMLIGPLAVAARVLWNRVCLSFHPFIHLSGRFLWIVSITFSNFWHGARNPCEVVRDRARFSRKNFFVTKMGKMGQK